MTLQQVRYFLAAVEHGSFSAAADALLLAPPSLSDQIRRLEGEFGTRLFARTRPTLTLTDAGRAFVPQAARIVRATEDASRAVMDIKSLRGGEVTFGLFRNSDYYLLADVVEDFLSAHPLVRLRLLGQNSAEVADAVRHGRVEAGLVVLPIEDDGLEVRLLLRDEVLYVSAEPDRVRAPVTIEELVQAPLMLYDAHFGLNDPTRRQLAERAQRLGLVLQPRLEVERTEAALQLVARGVGDTIVASALLASGAFPELSSAPFADPLYDVVALVQRRGVDLSAASREFLQVAERRLRALASGVQTIELLDDRLEASLGRSL